MTEMMSHLHDSHVGVTSPVLDKIFGALSPVGLRWIENSAVVTGFLDEAAANKSGIQVGDVILTVNGEDVRGRLERLKKYVSASTPGRLMQDALMRLLAGEYRTPVEVTGAGQE